MVDGKPDLSGACRCRYDVILLQPEDIPLICLYANLSPASPYITSLVERRFINIYDPLALSELLSIEKGRKLALLLSRNSIVANIGPIDLLVGHPKPMEDLQNGGEAHFNVEFGFYLIQD